MKKAVNIMVAGVLISALVASCLVLIKFFDDWLKALMGAF